MNVILKQDISNLGHKDDIVVVKDGYARNYLIPKGFALNATAQNKKVHEEILRQRAHKEAQLKEAALILAEELKKVSLIIGAKTSTKGKIFGSVNTIQIAEALTEKGFDLERKNISISDDLIKEIGSYSATVKLHKEVLVEVPFEIVSE
ncbi:MAG: 50S ribosomal protein L9 [Bacteroidia bacterium]|nr:50S ribosomal protein L9 [Bacteroidales bacterium]TFH23531.1 MAG: 50S ribosomal protein L9 [Bacteroidia bacterium]